MSYSGCSDYGLYFKLFPAICVSKASYDLCRKLLLVNNIKYSSYNKENNPSS